jgi:hypothetical protein
LLNVDCLDVGPDRPYDKPPTIKLPEKPARQEIVVKPVNLVSVHLEGAGPLFEAWAAAVAQDKFTIRDLGVVATQSRTEGTFAYAAWSGKNDQLLHGFSFIPHAERPA